MRLHTNAASNPKIVLNDLPSCRHQHAIGIAAAQLSAIKEGSLLATAPREEMFSKNNRVLAISSIVFNFFSKKSYHGLYTLLAASPREPVFQLRFCTHCIRSRSSCEYQNAAGLRNILVVYTKCMYHFLLS